MKISEIELITFHLPTRSHGTRWGYGQDGDQQDGVQTITKIVTDDGAEGFSTGGVHSYFYGASAGEIEVVVKLTCPPKTDPTLELEFRNRRKGRYGSQEIHA